MIADFGVYIVVPTFDMHSVCFESANKMISLQFAVALLLVVNCALSVAGAKKACSLEDSACTTSAAKDAHKLLIEGVPGQVKPSDPLIKPTIVADLPDLKYTLSNGKFIGLKDCIVDLVKISPKTSTFQYNLACPHIVVEGDYEVNGRLGGLPIEGKGKCKVDCEDYHILFSGSFETKTGSDGKIHTFIKTWEANVEPKGKVSYDIQNLFNGDQEKAAAIGKYVSENTKSVDDLLRPPAINGFMGEYIVNINDYLGLVPAEVLFAQ